LRAFNVMSGPVFKVESDPRVTKFGGWLRRTSLDELPQLLNVLRGDMSLIGPRPLLAFMLAPHGREAEARALVRPGLTGLWQIRDRPNNLSAAAMMPHDLEYIGHFSLALDLKILLRTPAAVLSARGAV
jgi:lipopolysaccharide/colanic/teichoic acid biosynthesis glycosyltransferase